MPVIDEEETDRENEESLLDGGLNDANRRFNSRIREVIDGGKHFEEVVNFYKSEMQDLARELVKQTEKAKRMA